MSAKEFRGANSKANGCMWQFADYVARVKPVIAVFESVQPARTRPDGHDLMKRLRAHVEEQSGLQYTLYHVRHNAYSVGGCSIRPRYFWVISQVPFGIEIPKFERYPNLADAIGDLQDLPSTWKSQPYVADGGWWSSPRRSIREQVDGHWSETNPMVQRAKDLMAKVAWAPREHIGMVARRYHEAHGELPKSWAGIQQKVIDHDFFMGFISATRWDYERPARVITGAGPHVALHPTKDRTLSHREIARVMGFPDDWLIEPIKQSGAGLNLTWGKGITVDCGRWIGEWIHHALDGNAGTHTGELIGEREYDIDVTNCWKPTWYSKTRRTTRERVPSPTRGVTVTETTPDGTETPVAVRAGRPRPSTTLERDEKVFEFLTTGGKTRPAIAEKFDLTAAEAYLVLHRLRKNERIQSERRDGAMVWFRPDVAEPDPEVETPAEVAEVPSAPAPAPSFSA